ncbi:MAG: hypothetical protein ACREUG_02160 [Steroidobacteraceae bacterium]
MERLLLLWDELDDLAGACRHVAASTAGEVATLAAPLAAIASVLGTGLLSLEWQAHRLLMSAAASAHWMF